MTERDAYRHPHPVDDVQLAFPAGLGDLLPPMDVIPADYPHRRDWERFQHAWFSGTLPADCQMEPADGIDAQAAGRHLTVLQTSYEPKHQHKVAAVAWLASRWFARVVTTDGRVCCPTEVDDAESAVHAQ